MYIQNEGDIYKIQEVTFDRPGYLTRGVSLAGLHSPQNKKAIPLFEMSRSPMGCAPGRESDGALPRLSSFFFVGFHFVQPNLLSTVNIIYFLLPKLNLGRRFIDRQLLL